MARDDETLLVFSTLGGGLTAVDPITSEVRWSIDDGVYISFFLSFSFFSFETSENFEFPNFYNFYNLYVI